MKLLKPTLYVAQDDAGQSGRPALLGRSCTCGHVFFPPQDYGCEKCGSFGSALAPRRLAGAGTLVSWATVHMHARAYPVAPFVVGKIALDDGPVVRALLRVPSEDGLHAGLPVQATLAAVGDAEGHVDLWFEPITQSRNENVQASA